MPAYSMGAIPPHKIIVGGLGELGSDGRRYEVLPNNVNIDVTPRVPGKGFYTFTADMTTHNLKIVANGADCAAEYPPSTPVFIVGQFVTFAPEWDGGIPPAIATETFKWRFFGSYLNDTNRPGCADCSENYFQNLSKLTEREPKNWWVSGNFDRPASYPVALQEKLVFANGQSAIVPAYGGIQMYRPKGKMTPVTSRVTIYINWLTFSDTDVDGITFFNTLAIPAGFSGFSDWIQVMPSVRAALHYANGTDYNRVQDGSAPYGDYPIPYDEFLKTMPKVPVDSPGELLRIGCVKTERADMFSMWMMYTPPGGIWVPLREVDWHWSGSATNTAGAWTIVSSDNGVDPDFEQTRYPEWNSAVKAYHWNPELP